MKIFGSRAKDQPVDFTGKTPVIRASICTGERVAGYKDAQGRFHELAFLRDDRDLDRFVKLHGLDRAAIVTEY
jgi:hypothetical protein